MADNNSLKSNTQSFRILFEDQHLIVLSKNPGLLSQGDHSGEPSLVDELRALFNRNYVGLIHRLDRNTSGLMVIAKRSKSAERLTQQLQAGELVRSYHAILWRELKIGESVKLEHWLLKNEATNQVKAVKAGTSGAKLAVLSMSALRTLRSSSGILTLARFTLETGRSHQIRAQAFAQGYPLIGDTKYGTPESAKLFSRPALHSCSIDFLHPMSGEKMSFFEAYAPDMLFAFPELSHD